MTETRTVFGADAYLVRALEKVELSARRAVAKRYPDGSPDKSLMREFADQLHIILKEVYANGTSD